MKKWKKYKTKIYKKTNWQIKLQENRNAHSQQTKTPQRHHYDKKNTFLGRDNDQPQVGQNNQMASKAPWPIKTQN
jgi:hypothetical protein